jgi:ketosteroid isomerase-like protein
VSQADEQLIRDAFLRWNEGERESLSDVVGPETEIRSALTPVRLRGREGLRKWFAEIDEQFQSWKIEVRTLEERAPGRFFGDGAIRARGRHSEMDLEQPVSWMIEVRDGRLVRFENYIGPDAAATASARAGEGSA